MHMHTPSRTSGGLSLSGRCLAPPHSTDSTVLADCHWQKEEQQQQQFSTRGDVCFVLFRFRLSGFSPLPPPLLLFCLLPAPPPTPCLAYKYHPVSPPLHASTKELPRICVVCVCFSFRPFSATKQSLPIPPLYKKQCSRRLSPQSDTRPSGPSH